MIQRTEINRRKKSVLKALPQSLALIMTKNLKEANKIKSKVSVLHHIKEKLWFVLKSEVEFDLHLSISLRKSSPTLKK